jgi:cell division protein YceG involved in septum cleavage
MTILKKLIYIVLGFFSVIFLSGCSSFTGVRNDFENAGYTYSEDAKEYIDELMEDFEEKDVIVTPHVFTKELNIAIVLEFSSTKELDKQIKESETLQGLLKDLQKSDYVRGNCLLIPIGLKVKEMIDIFQGK